MLVIIHGWSDDYRSFRRLANKLLASGVTDVIEQVHLGNYISLDDTVTFNDIVSALDVAWSDKGLPTAPRSVDAVVHSTGGLIVRDWFSRNFKPDEVPIKRLLMLAPANFGSPLAHTGRTFIGRALKGWKGNRLFHTGTQILKGLELASPYSWDLAFRDRFGSANYYGPGKILCTVLVGNTGYTGISAIANKPGTDGTVRISTANLECAFLDADFYTYPLQPKTSGVKGGKGMVAFAVVDGENHSTVAAKERGPKSDLTMDMIVAALSVEDNAFAQWRKDLSQHTAAVMRQREEEGSSYHGYQNTLFLVQDQYGTPVLDYLIEFYVDETTTTARENQVTRLIQEQVIANVHPYSDNSSYRSMLIDCTALYRILDRPEERLKISITAYPEFSTHGDVGYRSYTDEDIGAITLGSDEIRRLFKPNRTLCVSITLSREQSERVFEFRSI